MQDNTEPAPPPDKKRRRRSSPPAGLRPYRPSEFGRMTGLGKTQVTDLAAKNALPGQFMIGDRPYLAKPVVDTLLTTGKLIEE